MRSLVQHRFLGAVSRDAHGCLLLALVLPWSAYAQKAYVGNNSADSISIVDTATESVTGTIQLPLFSRPGSVAVTRDGSALYVLNTAPVIPSQFSNIAVIDTTARSITATVPLPSIISGQLVLTPDARKLYISSIAGNIVLVLDTSTRRVAGTIPVGTFPNGMAITPDGKKLLVVNQNSDSVSIIDTALDTVSTTLTIPRPRGITLTADGRQAYVTGGSRTADYGVTMIDTSTNSIAATVRQQTALSGIGVTPDGAKLFLANSPAGTVMVLDTKTNTTLATIGLGSGAPNAQTPNAREVVITPDGTKVFVVNSNLDTLSVISVSTHSLLRNITVGDGPTSMVIVGSALTNPNPPTISTTSLPAARIGTSYTHTLIASGGTPPYSWSATGLPSGLSLGAGSGVLGGTPSSVGSFTVNVTVTDSRGTTAQKQLSLTVTGSVSTSTPSIQSAQGIVNGASFREGFAAGAWITIRGSNLSATTRQWEARDFSGTNLPASLEGVRVTVNGRPAYVYYISPTQLNILAPEDATLGPVPVQVTNALGTSNVMMVTKQAVAPAIFTYSVQNGRYAIAQHGNTGALVGPANLFGADAPTTPAPPGEVITLYATGLGGTNPPYPDGQTIPAPAPVTSSLQVFIGNLPATVQFAGIIGPGLYQINAEVPAGASGDSSIVLNVNGTRSPDQVFIAVQGQPTTSGPGRSISYTYDDADRVLSITYPSGWKITYTRDAMGRITSVDADAPGGGQPRSVVSGVTYLPFGPVSGLKFGNGITETRTYDQDYRLTNLSSSGNRAVQGLTYAYDHSDNVLSITDAVTSANTQRFGYDSLDRLTSANGVYGNFGYTYDSVGNRLSQTLAASPATTYAYTPNTNRLASITSGGSAQPVTHTAAGSINSMSGNNYAYNQAGRLASASTGNRELARYTYSAFGNRLEKATPNGGTLYQYDFEGHLLEESGADGRPITDYIYLEDRPMAVIEVATGKLFSLHTERLGTPQIATDSAQAVAWVGNHEPFGALHAASSSSATLAQSLRFPGQEFDSETSFYQNGFRDYVPVLGRYLQSDAVGLIGGINTYQYASANPARWKDPSGTFIIPGNNSLSGYFPVNSSYAQQQAYANAVCSAPTQGFSLDFGELAQWTGGIGTFNEYLKLINPGIKDLPGLSAANIAANAGATIQLPTVGNLVSTGNAVLTLHPAVAAFQAIEEGLMRGGYYVASFVLGNDSVDDALISIGRSIIGQAINAFLNAPLKLPPTPILNSPLGAAALLMGP